MTDDTENRPYDFGRERSFDKSRCIVSGEGVIAVTLAEIKTLDREYLIPREVADVLGCDAHAIRIWARQRPDGLGFPVCIVGSRVKIPKRPFIQFMEGKA